MVKRGTYLVGGYGENEIGAFTLDGSFNLLSPEKLMERDGL
jgi:hypothetical protein